MNKKKLFIIFFIIFFIIVLVILSLYLSSFIFLLFAKLDYQQTSYNTIFSYYIHYKDVPEVMQKIKGAVTLTLFLDLMAIIGLLALIKPKKRELYGHSRMATKNEAIKALSAKDGILCGKIDNTYLSFGGSQHVLMEAPSRSGKGVGFVIPNCLNYNGSIVVLDIKGENYAVTSQFRREHGNEVFYFNPAPNAVYDAEKDTYTYNTHRWNFFGYVSKNPNERVNDIQKIANYLYPDGDNANHNFFQQQARALFLALVLFLFEENEHNNTTSPVTPGEVFRNALLLADKEYFKKLCESKDYISEIAKLNFGSYASLSENTASSVMGTITAVLELWANPIIDAATSANDFDLRELRKKRMSIYFIVTPDNIARFALLVNLFFQQTFELNLRELPEHNKALKYSCLFLLDEFTALGKIETIAKGIAYFAGYNLRLAIIIQSIAQLTAVYGEATKDTFVANLALRIIFAPKKIKVAEEIEKSLGYVTEKSMSKSLSKNWGKINNRSYSESVTKRAVMWAHELREIGQNKQIVLVDNLQPVLCDKIIYYKDKNFKPRLKGASIIPKLFINEIAITSVINKPTIKTIKTEADIEEVTADNIIFELNNFNYGNVDLHDVENKTYEEKKVIAENFADNLLRSLGLDIDNEDINNLEKFANNFNSITN